MSWLFVVVAGLLEVAWASVLPATRGFSRPAPTALFVLLLVGSMALLGKATETLPVGTADAVWVGIGATGTALVGVVLHDEPADPARLAFLALLVVAVVGLKAVSTH